MKKIMFNDRYGLTEAVLEGRKTMTRRFISEDVWQRADVYRHKHYEDTLGLLPGKEALIKFFPFKVGEVVAVAQSYETVGIRPLALLCVKGEWVTAIRTPGWKNKMFVSADYMCRYIRITNVRVERLQDISGEDCLREGIVKDDCKTYFNGYAFDYSFDQHGNMLAARWYKTPREAYAALIDKVCGKGTWADNPWVFAIEFEYLK